ncbi:unnamed protein product [Peniophora sp. CBMAI 1063]|nr:unnamed protein product [Peniophora sp. CBMAI 1063]
MPLPAQLAYQYKKSSVIAESAPTHAKAIEIARREFTQLRDVEDERIQLKMYVKRSATGYDAGPKRSRISPHNWETFFQMTDCSADKAVTTLFIEVDKLQGRSWAERLGFTKERKASGEEKRKDVAGEGGANLPVYSKTET